MLRKKSRFAGLVFIMTSVLLGESVSHKLYAQYPLGVQSKRNSQLAELMEESNKCFGYYLFIDRIETEGCSPLRPMNSRQCWRPSANVSDRPGIAGQDESESV